jgi:hypothetical protein
MAYAEETLNQWLQMYELPREKQKAKLVIESKETPLILSLRDKGVTHV